MKRILIVEDEPAMRLGLEDNLEFEGYEVETAEDGEIGEKMILEGKYDLILLDVMLPKKSGFDICKHMRNNGNMTPVILVTAKGEEIDKVVGLELGADDYITKPFSLRELIARIKAVLRRGGTTIEVANEKLVKIGKIEFDFTTYNAHENGEPIALSHKEFDIVHYLWNKKNSTVSRDELLTNIWGPNVFTTTRTIDNFILKLRQKMEDNPNEPKIILTVHGIGYKLINS